VRVDPAPDQLPGFPAYLLTPTVTPQNWEGRSNLR
jgi:hypothetical protein